MALKEKLLNDMKDAMREKDSIRKNTIQMVRAGILQVEKDDKVELNDDEIIGVIVKELKKRKDALTEFEKSGRQDLIDNLNREIVVLSAYLPEQLSEDELRKIVLEKVAEVGATSKSDIGLVMKAVLPVIKGKADGKDVNRLLSQILN